MPLSTKRHVGPECLPGREGEQGIRVPSTARWDGLLCYQTRNAGAAKERRGRGPSSLHHAGGLTGVHSVSPLSLGQTAGGESVCSTETSSRCPESLTGLTGGLPLAKPDLQNGKRWLPSRICRPHSKATGNTIRGLTGPREKKNSALYKPRK